MATCASDEFQISPSVVLNGTPTPPVLSDNQGASGRSSSIRPIETKLDATIFRLLTSVRTADEFHRLRKTLYPAYLKLAGALSTLIRMESELDVQAIFSLAFQGLETAFLVDRKLFGEDDEAREEGLFCLDALRRTHILLSQIADVPSPADFVEHDARLVQECLGSLWWSYLHLHCLIYGMSNSSCVPTIEVRNELLEGFRASVAAYASVRESWGLRFEAADAVSPENLAIFRDSEENALLDEAEADYNFIASKADELPSTRRNLQN